MKTRAQRIGWIGLMWIAGCNALAGIEEGAGRDASFCTTLADCVVSEPACRTALACTERRCVYEDQPEDTPLAEQVPGDCAQLVCDGAGRRKLVPDSEDVQDDGDACTLDECFATTPRHTHKAVLPCYTGPDGTRHSGVCADGVQHCDAAGNRIGNCEGQVLPGTESCISPFDEDCDGLVNEEGAGCVCMPGELSPCYTGPPQTIGVGECHAGTRLCSSDGLSFATSCAGEQTPVSEICDGMLIDEDCDGQTNEDGAGCACVPGELTPCYTGPAGTEGIGSCHGGLHDCEADGITFGPCMGEQTPEPENCDALSIDEDCDGDVNEAGPNCICGDGDVSNSEPCDDGNTQDGDGCTASCRLPIHALVTKSHYTCAVFIDGRVKCWGANLQGALGLGDTMPRGLDPLEMGPNLPVIDLGTGESAVEIGAGHRHTCALLPGGRVKCWGNASALGISATADIGDSPGEMGDALSLVDFGTGKQVISLSGGTDSSCAVLDDAAVKCWGQNNAGQLGQGDTQTRGDGPGEMGDSLPAVDLGTGKKVLALAAGEAHTCALLDDHSAKCWGYNAHGQLGLGDKQNRGDGVAPLGDTLPAVDFGPGKVALSLAAGAWHTCALLDDGTVKCWGYNLTGQLGLGDANSRGDEAGEMGDALPAVNLGTGKKAVAIAAGGWSSCALLDDGSAKCWGGNLYGQLGLGDGHHRGDAPGEMGDDLPALDFGTGKKPVAITAGTYHMCAALNNEMVKCWGHNGYGQLGFGSILSDWHWPPNDSLPEVLLW